MTMKVRDNSADDPVQGYVHDVTYCLEIPMVVKREKADEDDDLEIVGVTPATKNIVDVLKVKTEEKTPPLSPQKGAGSEPQKNMAEDKSTPPNKDMTGDNDSSPKKNTTDTEDKSTAHNEDEDMTEDNAVCPPKLLTPQKVKPKAQKTLGTTISWKLRSHRK